MLSFLCFFCLYLHRPMWEETESEWEREGRIGEWPLARIEPGSQEPWRPKLILCLINDSFKQKIESVGRFVNLNITWKCCIMSMKFLCFKYCLSKATLFLNGKCNTLQFSAANNLVIFSFTMVRARIKGPNKGLRSFHIYLRWNEGYVVR